MSDDEKTKLHTEAKTVLTSSSDEKTRLKKHDDATVVSQVASAKKSPQPTQPISNGSTINNRFVIDKLLGRGGMGMVYRAVDKRKQEAKDRNPFVAIKVLSDEFKRHPVAFVALQREARKSQDLAHPNVITVYDFDRDQDTVYMTMEELNGQPLDKYIRERPNGAPKDEANKIIKQIAQGLAYAHSKGIVHSDLKPGNIFVTDDDTVKVLDFGIARAVSNIGDNNTGDKTIFDAGELGGLTPTYASAEMFDGEDPHTSDDVFALGIIAYEIITGKHPFNREHANKILEKGLKPERIKSIPNHQWRTISHALELQREKRLEDAAKFLSKYEGISKTVVTLASSLILTVVVLGGLAIFKTPDSGPAIAFEDLPQETQSKVTTALASGAEALKFNDYNGALEHFNKAHELHPKNPKALKGLDAIMDSIIQENIDKNDRNALTNKKSQIDILLQYPALSKNERLLSARDKIINQLNQ